MDDQRDVYLEHIGIARRSGRYPWGSGKDPFQRSVGFKSYMDEMKAKGLSESQIAEALTEYANAHAKPGERPITLKSQDLRAGTAISTEQIYAENRATAMRMRYDQDGNQKMSTSAIARHMGVNESTVRGWLKQTEEVKAGSLRATANILKEQLASKPYLDVGKGQHLYLGISYTRLQTALGMLRDEGYNTHPIKVPQLGTDKPTTIMVLTKGDVDWPTARAALSRGELRTLSAQSDDGGATYRTAKSIPVTVPSKQIEVRYGPDGGTKMDGVIELRRGVPELDLGASRYAQVRVSVDGSHYLKGMAMYADDLPAGVNIRFNTNKTKDEAPSKLDAMKPLKTIKENGVDTGKVDPSNPFGATAKPKFYKGKDGKEHESPLNIVNEEGRWDEWSKSLSSQMLSKQSLTLASTQLGKAQAKKQADLDEILALTNPVVKKKMLEEFADSADSAAVHLKAAAMDRQSTHVILPMNTMRPNEIYAPNFNNGEKVALVRHPHGGPFEIASLTVNNKNLTARRIMGTNPTDAVGIHHSVAEKLSGADFDGDTVLVIPNDRGLVKSRDSLEGLKNFNPKESYKIPDDDTTTPRMTKKNTQTEMGKISNLITDMSIHKANDDELARAVRHSMVVIDAEKHGLDYKRSEKVNNISDLKAKYQGGSSRGAATLISRSSSEIRIPQRKEITGDRGVDPKTGEKLYVDTGKSYVNKKGEVVTNISKVTRMEYVKDARDLLSEGGGQPIEHIYANHANAMKSLANQARKESIAIKAPLQSKAAKAVYAKEVESLHAKLALAERNAPLERRAQVIGNAMAKAKIDANPHLDKDDIKKIKYQALDDARVLTGAAKKKIGSEDSPLLAREWEAIQAGAISATTLRSILANANMDRVKELATPRARTSLTPGQLARARSLVNSGKTMSEIAASLGIPRSTLSDNLASD